MPCAHHGYENVRQYNVNLRLLNILTMCYTVASNEKVSNWKRLNDSVCNIEVHLTAHKIENIAN